MKVKTRKVTDSDGDTITIATVGIGAPFAAQLFTIQISENGVAASVILNRRQKNRLIAILQRLESE